MTDLSVLEDRLEERLRMVGNVVISSTALTEAIRSAVGRLSEVYGSMQTLAGLDTATETSLETLDFETLLIGAELQILTSLLAGHFTDFSSEIEQEDSLNNRIKEVQKYFDEARERIRQRLLQKSSDSPWSEMDYEEEIEFS